MFIPEKEESTCTRNEISESDKLIAGNLKRAARNDKGKRHQDTESRKRVEKRKLIS